MQEELVREFLFQERSKCGYDQMSLTFPTAQIGILHALIGYIKLL